MNLSFWTRHPTDNALNALACRIIYLFGTQPVGTNIIPLIGPFFDTTDVIDYHYATTGVPRWLRVSDGPNMLMFLCGGEDEAQVELVRALYYRRFLSNFTVKSGFQSAPVDALMEMTNNAPTTLTQGRQVVRYFGHSFGGMIAHVASVLGREPTQVLNSFATSYGCPRMATRATQGQCQSAGNIRFMAELDPITGYPPYVYENTAVRLWNEPLLDTHFDTLPWVHIPNGFLLRNDGGLQRQEIQPLITSAIVADWIEEWAGTKCEDAIPHRILRYLLYWQQREQAANNSFPPASPPVDVSLPVTVRTREPMIRIGEAVIETELRNPLSRLHDIQLTPVDPSVNKPYRARKAGDIWYVVRDGHVWDIGPGKRSAKAKARRLNRATKKI